MPSRNKKRDEETTPLSQVLDESFECMHRMALSMVPSLACPKDRKICRSTLEQLVQFNKSKSLEVKQNVRIFLRFYLQVIRWTQLNQPIKVYERWYGNACQTKLFDQQSSDVQDEVHVWLDDGRSYLAMKHFEDGSAMIYSAVAKDASAGWVENGLKVLRENLNKEDI